MRKWLDRLGQWNMSETQRFLLLAVLIGVFAGLLVVCFHIAIDFTSWFLLGTPAGQNRLRTVLVPPIGAGAAAALILWVFRAAQGSGVNRTKAAIYISDGHVPFSTVVGKFLACSVSIGSGNSLGPEDPALQMGAGVASLLGRLFRLSRTSMRLIAPVGAAAGIGAAFNTPITAVLFVIEEVVGAWNAGVLGSTVLSAVSAVVVSRWFLGDQPLFSVPQFELKHPSELAVHALIGVAGGLLAVAFVRAIGRFRRLLAGLPRWAEAGKPVAAGLAIGCVGLWLPEVMGAGYEAVDSALHDHYLWTTLLVLGLVKIAVTLLCFGAGTPGGMFAPTLFIGAMIGGGIGGLAHLYWPFATSSAGTYVLVGMGTFFAGVFRAPMTSIFMVFEVSASYVIILPVMIANVISYLISRHLQPVAFFDLLARQEGMELPSGEEQREKPPLRVEDAMQTGPAFLLLAEARIEDALAGFAGGNHRCCLVARGPGQWNAVRRNLLEAAVLAGHSHLRLDQMLPSEPLPHLYPDLALDRALGQFGPNPILPVVSRAHPEQLLGTLTLDDIHQAYGISFA